VSGVLRASAARVNPPRPFLAASRFFSNLILQTHRIPGSLVFQGRHYPSLYQPCGHRMLSLGSIFSRSKPVASPTPLVVAHITRLEAEANVHPHDVAKQLALFEALLATNLKSSYELVITRWEKMCEFVSSVFCQEHLRNF
jgi:ATP-dependent metalloprotease